MATAAQTEQTELLRDPAVPQLGTARGLRDILVFMASYPHRTPRWAIEASLRVADRFNAQISGALFQKSLPPASNWLADRLVHANEIIAGENVKSRGAAQELLEQFESIVPADRRGEQILLAGGAVFSPGELVQRARAHDLTIVPVEEELEYQLIAEALVFEAGRPVLLMPEAGSMEPAFNDVMIGWDGSRAATRALSDSLPFCAAAKTVRLVQVTGEKQVSTRSVKDVQRHLSCHEIEARIEEVEAAGRDAGAALVDHGIETGANLLIMGAFGHSRTREFVLGGATRTVLGNVRLPILLSH